MTDSLNLNQSTVTAGLSTSTFTCVTAGLYTVSFTSFIPYIASGGSGNSTTATGGSGLSVVVNQDTGGGPVAKLTVEDPSPTQPIMGGSVRLQLDADDVVTVVLSSSEDVDAAPNAVKTIINLYQGE